MTLPRPKCPSCHNPYTIYANMGWIQEKCAGCKAKENTPFVKTLSEIIASVNQKREATR